VGHDIPHWEKEEPQFGSHRAALLLQHAPQLEL
jgi:hypothetical protein